MEDNVYYYKAHVIEVYDADTITVRLDLGLRINVQEKLRLARINAPEIRGEERPEGLVARDRLRELILDKDVVVQTIKDTKGKYGRYIAEIWMNDGEEWINVNDLLVTELLAEYVEY